jgi:hypothetical protein
MGYETVGAGKVGGGRREGDAVFEVDAADADGVEYVRVSGAHSFLPFTVYLFTDNLF